MCQVLRVVTLLPMDLSAFGPWFVVKLAVTVQTVDWHGRFIKSFSFDPSCVCGGLMSLEITVVVGTTMVGLVI
jgi:hypothetical protein